MGVIYQRYNVLEVGALENPGLVSSHAQNQRSSAGSSRRTGSVAKSRKLGVVNKLFVRYVIRRDYLHVPVSRL